MGTVERDIPSAMRVLPLVAVCLSEDLNGREVRRLADYINNCEVLRQLAANSTLIKRQADYP
jgi:ligand-binding sensor protein